MTSASSGRDTAKTTPPATGERREQPALGGALLLALVVSLIWVAAVLGLAFLAEDVTPAVAPALPKPLVLALAAGVPVLLVWLLALVLKTAAELREDSQRTRLALDHLRTTLLAQQSSAAGSSPAMSKKLDEIAETARKTESALATFHSSRRATPRPAIPVQAAALTSDSQGSLALGTPAEDMSPPLPMTEFIRALNFPETAEDEEGFAALRLALKDRKAAQVIQAAQDVLTLLSQDGIYMDDLRPDMARPEVWRQFATGTRGRAVAGLGGVRDRTSLTLAAARMKQDPIFRDAVHHFLRRFDRMFTDFESDASDTEISALSETRTARAFMLLGRVAGTFD